jgi:uncharacterized protein YkwD
MPRPVRFSLFVTLLLSCASEPEEPPWGGIPEGEETEEAETGTSGTDTTAADEDETATEPWESDAGDPGTSAPGTDGGTSDTPEEPPPPEVPDIEYCQDVAGWSLQWSMLEQEVLDLVNEERAAGGSCGMQSFPPSGPLTMEARLRCAARVHSKDMNDRDFFSHFNPDGEGPSDRVDQTGYLWTSVGENIASGYPTAIEVMGAWLESSGHCANIRNPDFTELGIGYYAGGPYGSLWTQVFASP